MTSNRLWAGVNRVIDLVYPGACHLCGNGLKGGRNLCGECAAGLEVLESPFCEICGESFDGAIDALFSCPNCRDQRFAFEFARPALKRSPGAMKLIHDLKYGRRIELGRELACLASRAFEDPRFKSITEEKWPLVPVPLHPERMKWRHFNQAMEIARPLGEILNLPVVEALRRTRATETQTRLTRTQRQKNQRGAFEWSGRRLANVGMVLIDDVFTTGSTVNECARILRAAGIPKVVVVTVMRG